MSALDRLRQVISLTTGPRRYDVAQFSEIIRALCDELADHPDPDVAALAVRLRSVAR